MTGSDPTTALIVVDMQNDFCPGGALGVDGGDLLAPALARAAERAGTVVATRDRHPADHISFAARGGPWPPHCVVGTAGAKSNLPGRHQVFRTVAGDVIGLVGEDVTGSPLLEPVIRTGALVSPASSLGEIRDRAAAQIAALPERVRALRDPDTMPPVHSPRLAALEEELS